MGRSITPTYRVECKTFKGRPYVQAWRGRANVTALAKWVGAFNAALLPGGVNEHVGTAARVQSARIVRQADGRAVAHHLLLSAL